ncbi:cation-independent mannose-6-phosphate receptor isoform X2 [Athalia rosae]|uniref:cation-independent mannose-6-phosphate receptor isoform X2 n=1 Tax=Athalia rosae TaxID=37344 RepID=UPI0020345B84|nr:cation-independent mannose-6-phosphate receptor isoform X2 [Athalia rosae]
MTNRSRNLLLFVTVFIHLVLSKVVSSSDCTLFNDVLQYTYDFTTLSASSVSVQADQDKEKIRFRLCSPLKQMCNGHDGYCVCLSKDDKEIGIGKFPPSLKYENGTSQFIYSGDPCQPGRNYTVHVIMKCDYAAVQTSPEIIPQGPDQCVIHMIWRTNLACARSNKHSCIYVDEFNNTYDLSSLTSLSDNHVVHIDDKTEMMINVCHTTIHEHGATCYGAPAACLKNSTDPNNVDYINYGELMYPSSLTMKDGKLQIKYDNGYLCQDKRTVLTTHQTTIYFICDPSASPDREAEYDPESGPCHYKFTWKTRAACNATRLREYRSANASKCTIVDPTTKWEYKLQSLMNQDFIVNASSSKQYKFRICGPLQNSRCAKETGICDAQNFTSAGNANANLMWQHGGPYLNYTDGAACGNGQRRYTLIAFVCGAEGSSDAPVVLKDEPCSLIIHWYTDRVCKRRILCATAKNETNLLPLIRSSKNYVIKAMGKEFHINICRPMAPTPNIVCPHGSAVCQTVRDSRGQYTNETSLGFPDQNPVLDGDENVILNYYRGSPCPEHPEKNISSSFKFFCDYNGDEGLPQYKNYSNCHYIFEWRTNIVCSTVMGEWVAPCTIKDASHPRELDLSLLYEKPIKPEVVSNKEKNWSINICGGKDHCNGSAICQGTNGYGTDLNVRFNYRTNVISLKYSNGTKCNNKPYESELLLICSNTSGIGKPALSLDANCMASFKWLTNIACAGGGYNAATTPVAAITETPSADNLKNYGSAQTWIVTISVLVVLVIGLWLCMRNSQRCGRLRSRIEAITSSRNHSRVQYSRVNTTEEARLLLDTSDPHTLDEQIDSDDELLGV